MTLLLPETSYYVFPHTLLIRILGWLYGDLFSGFEDERENQ